MKEIASNEKYVLSLVEPDEVFDILGKDDGGRSVLQGYKRKIPEDNSLFKGS